jgi:hypothetical protein
MTWTEGSVTEVYPLHKDGKPVLQNGAMVPCRVEPAREIPVLSSPVSEWALGSKSEPLAQVPLAEAPLSALIPADPGFGDPWESWGVELDPDFGGCWS